MNTEVIFLRHFLTHISTYSGYENFIKALDKEAISYKEVFRLRSLQRFDFYRRFFITRRNKKKANSIGPFYNNFSYLAEMETLKAVKKYHPAIVHNTFLEDNHGFLGQYQHRHHFKLIATSHQPIGWWKYMNKSTACLKDLALLLTVTSREQEYFEKIIPGRVRLACHGVDTDFFCNTNEIGHRPLRLLFVGTWLRDVSFFEQVVLKLLAINKEILIDMVYPINMDLNNPLFRLCQYPNVTLHRFISNEQLLYLYNHSRLLFLPLIDSTANNALMEGLSCGVPVVTNGLPGTRDYSNDSIAYYYKNSGDCVDYILATIKDDKQLGERSAAARNFMCTHFSLNKVSTMHTNIYREFA